MRALLADGVPALDVPPGGAEHHDELTPAGTRRLLARWSAPLENGGNGDAGRIVVLRDVSARA